MGMDENQMWRIIIGGALVALLVPFIRWLLAGRHKSGSQGT